MPVYTLQTLLELKESDLVTVPEFKWNEIEKVAPGANGFETGRRRSSHHSKRPTVMPKAAIPFSQRLLRDGEKEKLEQANENEDAENSDEDEDEFAARYLLRSKPKNKKTVEETDEDGAPVVNLKYAAALAASMKMADTTDESSSAVAEEEAPEEDAGWVSVTQGRQRRTRKGGSFSKWRTA